MKIPRLFSLLVATASLSLPASFVFGAPLPINDATYAGAFTAGTPENITGNATVAGITTSEGTFTGLLGATANAVVTSNASSAIGTAPADANAAATGLSANDGINNLNTGNFQFSLGTFNVSTRFFIIESAPTSGTPGDTTTVTLINASNAQVGTYTLTLQPTNFTASTAGTTATALATLSYTSGVASVTGGVQSKLGGVTFSLADFAGTGDLSTVTGIALTSGTLDPNVVGAYSVPEPSTYCFLVAALVPFVLRYRRKICKP